MDRQKITVPDRNFSVPERNYTVHARGEFIAKPRTAAKPTNSVDSITPAQAAPPPTPEVGRKVAPITSSMNTSKGVYIDNIKKPTLNNNTRVSIAPPKIDEVKAEVAKAKFEESLVDLVTNEEVIKNEKIAKNEKPIKNEKPAPTKAVKVAKKKKKFLFW